MLLHESFVCFLFLNCGNFLHIPNVQVGTLSLQLFRLTPSIAGDLPLEFRGRCIALLFIILEALISIFGPNAGYSNVFVFPQFHECRLLLHPSHFIFPVTLPFDDIHAIRLIKRQ